LGIGLLLVVGANLPHRLPAGGIGIEGLVQEGQEAELGGVEPFSAVGLVGVGGQQRRVQPIRQEALPVMERTAAQRLGRLLERGVELAEEFSGGEHISVYIQIRVDKSSRLALF
jgi:hypothetical protein